MDHDCNSSDGLITSIHNALWRDKVGVFVPRFKLPSSVKLVATAVEIVKKKTSLTAEK